VNQFRCAGAAGFERNVIGGLLIWFFCLGIAALCIGLGGWSVKVVRQLKPSVGGCSENETTTGRGLLLDTALLPPPGNACWITLPGLSARHPVP